MFICTSKICIEVIRYFYNSYCSDKLFNLFNFNIILFVNNRFPFIMKGLTPQKAASLIIDAQRQNFRERSIPSYWLPILRLIG